MRSLEKSLSHFGDVGLMPRRVRRNEMLHTIQLEWAAEKMAEFAHKVVEDAIELERIEETYESEMQIRANAVIGKREWSSDVVDAPDINDEGIGIDVPSEVIS